MPDFKPDAFSFPPHLVVPKTQHFDALLRQKTISFFVADTLIGKAVPAAVEFHRPPRSDAKKIQEVDAARILATKFEFCKAPGAEQTPGALPGIGGLAAERAGEITGFSGTRPPKPPHPNPLPLGGKEGISLVYVAWHDGSCRFSRLRPFFFLLCRTPSPRARAIS
jgi:hypothetical protein